MDPEDCVPAHNLYISVLEVERFVVSSNPFAVSLSRVIAKFSGVKSDMVEMLKVGEEVAVIWSLKGASEGGSAPRRTEGYWMACKME